MLWFVFIQVLLQSAGQECVWFGTSQRDAHLCHWVRCVSCHRLQRQTLRRPIDYSSSLSQDVFFLPRCSMMFILLRGEIFKYKTIPAAEADYQMYTALRVFHSQNQVDALSLCCLRVLLPLWNDRILFSLSDDPLLIERPPGKFIHRLHVSNLTSKRHVLPNLHWGFKERDIILLNDRIYSNSVWTSLSLNHFPSVALWLLLMGIKMVFRWEPDGWIGQYSLSQKHCMVYMLANKYLEIADMFQVLYTVYTVHKIIIKSFICNRIWLLIFTDKYCSVRHKQYFGGDFFIGLTNT